MKIAVVEDDLAINEMYCLKLRNVGYEVKSATDGEQGLELTKSFQPDLILLDLRMPIMTGDVMLRRMRSTDWGSKPRVVILTNISRDEAPIDLRFLHVDRYIVKAHHTPIQVVEIVREILSLPREHGLNLTRSH